jgi:hypothetical protein
MVADNQPNDESEFLERGRIYKSFNQHSLFLGKNLPNQEINQSKYGKKGILIPTSLSPSSQGWIFN